MTRENKSTCFVLEEYIGGGAGMERRNTAIYPEAVRRRKVPTELSEMVNSS